MRIWILNHYATPTDMPGLTRHFDFAKELTRRGHQVSIFASSFAHTTRRNDRLKRCQQWSNETIDGVEFWWLRTFPYHHGNDWRRVVNMLSYSLRVPMLGLWLRPPPHVILASSPHPFAGLCGYVLARVRGSGFVFEVRDLWPQTLVDIGGYSPRSPVVRALAVLERFLYRRADRVVVLGPMASQHVRSFGVPEQNIVHIPNGVDAEMFEEASAVLPCELQELVSKLKSDGKFVVGYAGAHGIANALDTLIEAAVLVRDKCGGSVHFLMVGDGPEKKRLVEYARELGLDNISFFGSIPKKAVPRLLANLDVAVISWRRSSLYRYGTSSNKLLDYMMSARPVVWAIDSPYDPVACAGCGITVPPEAPSRLADAIVEIGKMTKEQRQEMGMRGYEYVMEHHSTRALAAQLLNVLCEATAR